ncbi:hypothetical protein DEJ28_08685 [Curtobacterium sp. MCPF17_002]|uniref:META domain-containing protein n=1 Tax=Curtobacterium sp. MCPF17_002 TaxID=2175645 RepID=UPI000DA9805E|nr:hypothetical protein [Curtobacterium sp. MCPF17_002]WIB79160.1 hypothetical protein DEJ28_08685 [Curtobacterium sp. MCPF17_002]
MVVSALAVACTVGVLAGCTLVRPTQDDARKEEVTGTWVLDQQFDTPEVPFVSFGRSNVFSASDGCDRISGTWRITAARDLTVVVGPHAESTCAGKALPIAAMQADTARVQHGDLRLRGPDGTTTLARTTADGVGKQARPIGYWVQDHSSDSAYLSLRADDSYRLYDGCVTREGTWRFSHTEHVRLTPGDAVVGTCPDGAEDLSASTRARVADDVMTLSTTGGNRTGELHRYRL